MAAAEFEERSYEAALYSQLQRASTLIFVPGQVLESRVGFDSGLHISEHAVWTVLGYRTPPRGAALRYYDWLPSKAGSRTTVSLPSFRLNLFLQAKRPDILYRCPKHIRGIGGIEAPLWRFVTRPHQQDLLARLASTIGRRAHVAYAAPAFNTYSELYRHTKRRSVVANSTFPSASALSGHSSWHYDQPGSIGVANPDPQLIEEAPLLDRLRGLSTQSTAAQQEDLGWLTELSDAVMDVARTSDESLDPRTAQFFDDLQFLEGVLDPFRLPPLAYSYATVRIFAFRHDLTWLLVSE